MRKILLVLSSVALAGCGGGGGTSATLGAFSSFSKLPDGAFTQTISGFSQEVSYTADLSTDSITSLSTASTAAEGASAILGENSSGQMSASFSSALGTNASFSEANGDTFTNLTSIGVIYATDSTTAPTKEALVVDPIAAGWDYQTFGIWLTGVGSGSGKAAVASLGAATSGSSIPTSGFANYAGAAGGLYVDPAGDYSVVRGALTANVDFGARSVAIQTSGTADAFFGSSRSELNMNGTLSYNSQINNFTGTLTTVGGGTGGAALSGTATGKFYGPSAQEIGGTFGLTDGVTGSVAGYLGGFGAK